MDNPIKTRSIEFALKMVRLWKRLMEERKEFILSKQLIRSATSVGAGYLSEEEAGSILTEFLEIEKTLCAIVNTSKKKKAKPPPASSAA